MLVSEPHPLVLTLEEAEETAGSRTPFVVRGKTDARVVQDLQDVSLSEPVILEREDGHDVRLVRDVAITVLVAANPDVGERRVVADPCLERFDLEVLSAPAHLRRRQRSPVDVEPMIEITV